ncbi:YdcF family protein [Amycolatopsis alkalitolerans]|uniref:YdcF family protein n=1 Tax=Amycolatopsis alkalitolerans TaxID=2547244 RepID=A0A5C4LWF2_9PSEU|nr:YdcF family protein [Amycolatopsis alkalitolerans]TNC22271.1 YdcF family protein [Amycolatopsis alkalitolerans]
MRKELLADTWADAEIIWRYHRLGHRPKKCGAAVVLGCHDLTVAAYAAELYHRGLFPVVVFSGANSRETFDMFPRGEGVHYRERALELGVPDEAILVEPQATNTGENITLSREILCGAGISADPVMLVSMPYMERRAYATTRKVWPEVEPVCASVPLSLTEYRQAGDHGTELIDMMIGDLQRIIEYPGQGFAIFQDVPPPVRAAYQRLVAAGFSSRML